MFPRAAITNYYKVGSLKQQSSFSRSSEGQKCEVWRGWAPSEGSSSFSWFQGSLASVTPISASVFAWTSPLGLCLLFFCLLHGLLSLDLGSTWIIQDELITRCFITSAETLFHRFWGLGHGHIIWGGPVQPTILSICILMTRRCTRGTPWPALGSNS